MSEAPEHRSCDPGEITRILDRLASGDAAALEELLPRVYAELRNLAQRYMRGERPDHSWQPTDLVHEAYVRLLGSQPPSFENRAHFLAAAAQSMRRILVEHARARGRKKRQGNAPHLPLHDISTIPGKTDVDVLDLEDALTALATEDTRKARVVELLYFGGCTSKEAAEVLEVTPRTIERDWAYARVWLYERLST